MADVQLELDADHADYLARAVGVALDSYDKWWSDEQKAVLRGIREVIHTQMSPESMP